jgi:8-oxo-dGTP diphosphatase
MSELKVGVGVAVIIVRDEKVLLGLRKGSHGAGTWSTPGGKVDFGESIEACAIRETREETGLNIDIIELHAMGWNEKVWLDDNKHFITIYTLGRIIGNENYDEFEIEPIVVEPTKCEEWRWFDADEIPKLNLFESSRMGQILIESIYEARLLSEVQ